MVARWRVAALATTLGAIAWSSTDGLALAAGVPSVSEECVAAKVAEGKDRTQAVAECLQEARQSAPTTAAASPATSTPRTLPPPSTSSGGDDGTSIGLLVAVGVGGLLIGAGVATLLARRPAAQRSAAPTGGPAPSAAPPPPVAPPPIGAAMASPSPGLASGPDRAQGLVTGLIELSDRLPSQALRAEVMAMLARAGVQPIEVATGEAFDPARMRGVGGSKAVDATWVGRVATTERCGFSDGATIVRPPEVIVYTADG